MPSFSLRVKWKLIRTFFREQWSLLVCDPKGAVLTIIVPPADRQWADPFPVEHNSRLYIFLEQQIGHGNGTLGVIELSSSLSPSSFTPILEKEYHLSFPHVFCLNDGGKTTWYMIPESHENGTIDLYRSVDFPYKWEYLITLIKEINAVDTVLFYHESKWWLFTSISSEDTTYNAALSLFYSDKFPSNNWTPHPQNPVVKGLGNSRMAGAVFRDQRSGALIRPAQNCLKDYGKETNLNEILELSPVSYRERTVETILPEKSLRAVCTHTINHSEHFLLRDIKTRIPRIICHK